MNQSIQTKLFMMCLTLVIVTTLSLSATYYLLTKQDKQRESRQRIRIAFEIILDDLNRRFERNTQRFEDFLTRDTSIGWATSSYNATPALVRSAKFIVKYLVPASEKLKGFGYISAVERLAVYTPDARLLLLFGQSDEGEQIGGYVTTETGNDAYLRLDDLNLISSITMGRETIAENPLPKGFLAEYSGDIPEKITSEFVEQNGHLVFRITAPVYHLKRLSGILVGELVFPQSAAEHYALLSKTEVNFFAGDRFSIGTLPEQTLVKPESPSPMPSCQRLLELEEDALHLTTQTFGSVSYFQEQCALAYGEQTSGAITVSLSKAIEQQAVRKILTAVLMISGIVFALAFGISVVFSRTIGRPIKVIATLIHQISHGDLTGLFAGHLYHNNAGMLFNQTDAEQRQERDELAMLTHSFYEMAGYLKDVASIADKISHGNVGQTITPRSEHDTLSVAFRNMLTYIQNITDVAKDLAEGNLLVDVQPKSDEDILNHSLRKMIFYIQGIANVTETISEGNLDVNVQPKSAHDVLNHSLQRMVAYIRNVAEIAENISQNNLDLTILPQSEHDTLSISLQRMIANLQNTQRRIEHSMSAIEQQNWLKTGQAELNNVMRGEQEPLQLAQHIIAYLAEYTQAQVGALYLAHHSGDAPMLQIVSSYAYHIRDANRVKFAFGEGIVGQAALEQECLLYSELPDDYITITTETGQIQPNSVLVAPFLYEGHVNGVIELGAMQPFSEQHLDFLNTVTENIAIALHTAQARVKMQALLTAFQQTGTEFPDQPIDFTGERQEFETS